MTSILNLSIQRGALSSLTLFMSLPDDGFDLSDSLINASEVFPGGPPRDGIPAIDQPEFVSAEDADFLSPDDRILGLVG
ncbi:MAG: hypothetical protein ABW104_04255 [Candidatus Thiodiazotropha sp. 6PLUC2]